MERYKHLIPYAIAVLLFGTISGIFFSPLYQGKTVNQSDVKQWYGAAHQTMEYNKSHDETAFWTNSMFGGMPAEGVHLPLAHSSFVMTILHQFLYPLKHIANYIFIAMLGAFILLLVLRNNVWTSTLGAVGLGLATYFFLLIEAGHNAKVHAIAWSPWVVASLLMAWRRSRWWGTLFLAWTVYFQIRAGHPQVSYFLFVVCLGVGSSELYKQWREGRDALQKFIITTILLLLCSAPLGLLSNYQRLTRDGEYAKHTMRGGSELKQLQGQKAATKDGLSKDYALAWSQSWSETGNMLIPSFAGSPMSLEQILSSPVYEKALKKQYSPTKLKRDPNLIRSLGFYGAWGATGMQSGSIYFGAIIIFLFFLGMFLVRDPIKYGLLGAFIIILLIALGSNAYWFSSFLLDYAPLYNKFRAPGMAISLSGLILVPIGILGLNRFLLGTVPLEEKRRSLYRAVGLTGGFCLLAWLVPSIAGDFGSAALDNNSRELVVETRQWLLRSDALRSLSFILGAALLLWLWLQKKISNINYLYAGLGILILWDMWGIAKRFLNEYDFQTKKLEQSYTERPVDKSIRQDNGHYRVLDLSVSTFNDNHTSYFHHNVGGYSPVKLSRYQDLIDAHISQEIGQAIQRLRQAKSVQQQLQAFTDCPVLNMLNTKYIIFQGNAAPLVNQSALGTVWFVDSLKKAANALEEIQAMKGFNPGKVAIVDTRFEERLSPFSIPDSASSIHLESWTPNKVVYKSSAEKAHLAVFSEVYYEPLWKLYVDGNEVPNWRVNYILRGAVIPAGEHTIEWRAYDETSTHNASISLFFLWTMIIISLGAMVYSWWQQKKNKR